MYGALSLAFVGQGLLPGRTISGSDSLWGAAPWKSFHRFGVEGFGTNFELSDPARQFQPFLFHTRTTFPHVPLWDPYIMAGRPFLGNAQSAVFGPFSWPAYVLPFWHSLALIAALKLFTAALGTFLLGRALGMRFGGSLFAGIVYAFGLFMVVWLGFTLSSVWALIPWLLFATDSLLRRPGALPFAGLSAAVALQYFGGHPESSFHALFATTAFAVLRGLHWRKDRNELARGLAVVAGALVVGTLLAAIAVLPFVELLLRSDALRDRGSDPVNDVISAKWLLGLMLPNYWGRSTQIPTVPFVEAFRTLHAFYAGAPTLLLALAALAMRPTRERVAVAGFGLFAVAIVVGVEPLYGLVTALPGFENVKNYRMIVLVLLCLALLAGWGLDDLAESPPTGRRRTVITALGITLLCTPVAIMAIGGSLSFGSFGRGFELAWEFATPTGHSEDELSAIRVGALLEWLVLAGASVALIALRVRRKLSAPLFVGIALALVTFDLFKAGVGVNPAIPIENARQPTTPAIRYLQARSPSRFVGTEPRVPLEPLTPNVAILHGLYDARGYDHPVEDRYDRFWSENVQPRHGEAPTSAPVTPDSLRALGTLGVRYVVQGPGAVPPTGPGVHRVYHGSDATIYANDRALPRAFLVPRQRVVQGDQAQLAAVSAPRFDGLDVAVTGERVPSVATADSAPRSPPGSARVSTYEPERVKIETRAAGPRLLVLTDVFYPGWDATVDGRPTEVNRVNYLLRGVSVPPGDHVVEFRYRPLSYRIGWIVSLLTLLGLGVAVALTVLRPAGIRRR